MYINAIPFLLLILFIYLRVRDWFCVGSHSKCPQQLGLDKNEARGPELNVRLPHQWQQPNHLSHHCWLPRSALAENGSQETQPGIKPRCSSVELGTLTSRLNTHFWFHFYKANSSKWPKTPSLYPCVCVLGGYVSMKRSSQAFTSQCLVWGCRGRKKEEAERGEKGERAKNIYNTQHACLDPIIGRYLSLHVCVCKIKKIESWIVVGGKKKHITELYQYGNLIALKTNGQTFYV